MGDSFRFTFTPENVASVILTPMTDRLEDDVARRLKAVRLEMDLAIPQMAERLGVGRTRYLNWERADNLPAERVMIKLCELAGITMDYLYRGRVAAMPTGLALRLIGREMGEDPEAESFPSHQVAMAFTRASRHPYG
jgi:transcriptional regulator with XRE-family HTH domain